MGHYFRFFDLVGSLGALSREAIRNETLQVRAEVSILKLDLARQLHVLLVQCVAVEALQAINVLLGADLMGQLRGRVTACKHLFLLVLRGPGWGPSVIRVAGEDASMIMMTLICEITRQGEGVACPTHRHLVLRQSHRFRLNLLRLGPAGTTCLLLLGQVGMVGSAGEKPAARNRLVVGLVVWRLEVHLG